MYRCFSCEHFVRRGLVDNRYEAHNTCTYNITKPMKVAPYREACPYYEFYYIEPTLFY